MYVHEVRCSPAPLHPRRFQEEADLRAHYERLAHQRDAELLALRERAQQEEREAQAKAQAQGQGSWQGQGQQMGAGAAAGPAGMEGQAADLGRPRRGRSKVIVDASWLDQPRETSMGGDVVGERDHVGGGGAGAGAAGGSGGGAGPGPLSGAAGRGSRGGGFSEDGTRAGEGLGLQPGPLSGPLRRSKDSSSWQGPGAGRAGNDGEVPELLHKLQQEQVGAGGGGVGGVCKNRWVLNFGMHFVCVVRQPITWHDGCSQGP